VHELIEEDVSHAEIMADLRERREEDDDVSSISTASTRYRLRDDGNSSRVRGEVLEELVEILCKHPACDETMRLAAEDRLGDVAHCRLMEREAEAQEGRWQDLQEARRNAELNEDDSGAQFELAMAEYDYSHPYGETDSDHSDSE